MPLLHLQLPCQSRVFINSEILSSSINLIFVIMKRCLPSVVHLPLVNIRHSDIFLYFLYSQYLQAHDLILTLSFSHRLTLLHIYFFIFSSFYFTLHLLFNLYTANFCAILNSENLQKLCKLKILVVFLSLV